MEFAFNQFFVTKTTPVFAAPGWMHDMAWFDDFSILDSNLSTRKSAVLRGCRLCPAANYLEYVVFYAPLALVSVPQLLGDIDTESFPQH